ncbi:MAG: chorismate mutase [Prevotellaceae bacterium]|jgi:isochorismate pyruvate lyase|nr:chorismate mutase [Prevotellaceae bacterium]
MKEVETAENLDEVRENIDRIDRQIVQLIAERGAFVRQASNFRRKAVAKCAEP